MNPKPKQDDAATGRKPAPKMPVPEVPVPEVEDPHPGSISDGTHPEASETKSPRGNGG
jgi:hypothetical protein